MGSTWKYFQATPPANWFATDFPDAGWSGGPAKLGAGTGPQHIRTALTPRQPAYYFRKKFNMDAAGLQELLLVAKCTDDYASVIYPMSVYLNGVEIPGPVEAVSGEGNVEKYFDLTPFSQLLRRGENTIAVTLRNTWQNDWDNVSFDVGLKGVRAAVSVARFVQIERDSTVTLRMIGPQGSTWRLESSDNLATWGLVQNVSFDSAEVAMAVDNGQNGRAHPSAVSKRFYRLKSNQ